MLQLIGSHWIRPSDLTALIQSHPIHVAPPICITYRHSPRWPIADIASTISPSQQYIYVNASAPWSSRYAICWLNLGCWIGPHRIQRPRSNICYSDRSTPNFHKISRLKSILHVIKQRVVFIWIGLAPACAPRQWKLKHLFGLFYRSKPRFSPFSALKWFFAFIRQKGMITGILQFAPMRDSRNKSSSSFFDQIWSLQAWNWLQTLGSSPGNPPILSLPPNLQFLIIFKTFLIGRAPIAFQRQQRAS